MTYICIRPDLLAIYFSVCVCAWVLVCVCVCVCGASNTDSLIFILGGKRREVNLIGAEFVEMSNSGVCQL